MQPVPERDQIASFGEELDRLIHRTCKEYDIAIASVVGVLQCKAHQIINDSFYGSERLLRRGGCMSMAEKRKEVLSLRRIEKGLIRDLVKEIKAAQSRSSLVVLGAARVVATITSKRAAESVYARNHGGSGRGGRPLRDVGRKGGLENIKTFPRQCCR